MDTKFIKKNKFTLFIIVFFIVLFILLLLARDMFFPKSDGEYYGNRLDGLTEIKQDEINSLTEKIKENKSVKEMSVDIQGRIINIILTVDDSLSIKDSQNIGASSKDFLSDEIKKNYDIQVFVKKNNKDENNFPIIGYKSKTNDTFTWIKEREKTSSSEGE